MKEVAELDQELTIEERNLLSVAYKNIIVGVFCFPSSCIFSHHPSICSACISALFIPLVGSARPLSAFVWARWSTTCAAGRTTTTGAVGQAFALSSCRIVSCSLASQAKHPHTWLALGYTRAAHTIQMSTLTQLTPPSI